MLPAIRGEFRGDVSGHDDEVILVADLPGGKRRISRCSSSIRGISKLPAGTNRKPRKKLKAVISANACPVP
jgi:hypothetical protein